MRFYSSALCVLIFLISGSTVVSETDLTEVKVKLDDPATLPCHDNCSGSVSWSHSSSGVVARCDRTSCSAVEEGYEMSHDQYLKGNLSLFIPVADSSKVGVYICQCDRTFVESVVLCVKSNPVMGDLHRNATLPCNVTCYGVVTWTRSNYPDVILARCNQISCISVSGVYQMSRDHYLKGDFSLSITDAVFSMWDTYTCRCNTAGFMDVEFGINALNTSVQIKPGGSLVLDVDVSDPVEVVYNSTGADGSSSSQICSLQCKPDYTERAALQLRGMNVSDSGVYIIRDSSTEGIIHVYTVSVRDVPEEKKFTCAVWELVAIVLGAVGGGVLIPVICFVMCKKRESACGQTLEMGCVAGNRGNIQNPEQENILPPAPE